MHRMFVMVAFAAIAAGCGSASVRPDSASQSTQAASQSTEPADAVAEASPKKPKLSCVQ